MTSYDYYDVNSDYSQIEYFTYANGLLDEWRPFYGGVFKMLYNNAKKATGAIYSDGLGGSYDISFIYENNHIVREMWYEGGTTTLADVITHTYNQKGEMIRDESVAADYYVINSYTVNGDLASWTYYTGGMKFLKGEYTYVPGYKNPYESISGFPFNFGAANAAFGSGNWWYASEKVLIFDESGNESIIYAQDPGLTTWTLGFQKTISTAVYKDAGTGAFIYNRFTYDNCEPGNVGNSSTFQSGRKLSGKDLASARYRMSRIKILNDAKKTGK